VCAKKYFYVTQMVCRIFLFCLCAFVFYAAQDIDFPLCLSYTRTMLRKISVCQNTTCQNKGSKAVFNRLTSLYSEEFKQKYPDLHIEVGDCMGDCEQGPIVKVNDSLLLRHVDNQTAEQLLRDPESVMGQVMHVLEQDRETFDRIIGGQLF